MVTRQPINIFHFLEPKAVRQHRICIKYLHIRLIRIVSLQFIAQIVYFPRVIPVIELFSRIRVLAASYKVTKISRSIGVDYRDKSERGIKWGKKEGGEEENKRGENGKKETETRTHTRYDARATKQRRESFHFRLMESFTWTRRKVFSDSRGLRTSLFLLFELRPEVNRALATLKCRQKYLHMPLPLSAPLG